MNLEQELETIKLKIAELKEWNFGVCPPDEHFDKLLEKMWSLEAEIKEKNQLTQPINLA